MNVLERLEKLGKAASERPWATGQAGGALVTQGRCANAGMGAEDRAYYGGGLVGEAIGRADRDFIAAVVNALPDLLRVSLATAADIATRECEEMPLGPCGKCDFCVTAAALEPLLREAQP